MGVAVKVWLFIVVFSFLFVVSFLVAVAFALRMFLVGVDFVVAMSGSFLFVVAVVSAVYEVRYVSLVDEVAMYCYFMGVGF